MAQQIVVPELSESVVEATVAEWLKNVGDSVEAGETVVVLETDKVSLEVTAEADGTLTEIKAQEGDDVAPGDVLGTMEAGESAGAPSTPAQAEATGTPSEPTTTTPEEEETIQTANGQRVTPVAQRYAAEHDVDLSRVTPKDGQKITRGDIESYLEAHKQPQAPTPPYQQPQSTRPATEKSQQPSAPQPHETTTNSYRREERTRMSRRRQTIARRMVEAQSNAAMLTTFNEINMTAVMDLRSRRKEQFKEKHGVGLGLSSFFVKATIGALKAFPRLNAEIQDREIVTKYYYDIGIAIGAEEGLVVPVLRDAERMSFAEIEGQIREYAKQSQEGTLSLEALTGGTFSITNGGVFGSMLSTPILNPPQVGILGLHNITERPVAENGEVVIRPMMYVALTYDHRIVDGREAVQFLVRVKQLIEDPESLLIEG